MAEGARSAPAVASPQAIKEAILAEARALGFDRVAIASPAMSDRQAADLTAFLSAGYHGTMEWLAKRAIERGSPLSLWSEAKSVIVVGASYAPPDDPRLAQAEPALGAISVYAQGADYHDVLKRRLKQLARSVATRHGAAVKLFVDTSPVMEKPLAAAAGLGWQGKHTNLVSRQFGSWLFLGELFTSLPLPPDQPEPDHCGTCRRCLDACPTKAFPAPYRLDARRCISYLTIEHKGHIAREFRSAIGNRIYGCDDCLAVCPWNKFAQIARAAAFEARAGLKRPSLGELAVLDDGAFRKLFAGTSVKRIGRARFIRNVLIAIGNAGDVALAGAALRLLGDPEPIVRAAAIWALQRLLPRADFALLAKNRASGEQDSDVAAEWVGMSAEDQAAG
jgi:epoxyqueuosine reductase